MTQHDDHKEILERIHGLESKLDVLSEQVRTNREVVGGAVSAIDRNVPWYRSPVAVGAVGTMTAMLNRVVDWLVSK